jgi:hypothetical protein
MAHLLIRFFLALPTVFAAAIGLVQISQPDSSHLRALFMDSACDETPCFLGIELGRTSLDEARAILGEHPWIVEIADQLLYDYMGSEHLRFRWHWGEHSIDRSTWSGELIASYGTVYMVRLETGLTLGDLWIALGTPEIIPFTVVQSQHRPVVLLYSSFFSHRSVAVASALHCPLSYRHFLQGEVYTLELRRRTSFSATSPASTNPALLLRWLRESEPLC